MSQDKPDTALEIFENALGDLKHEFPEEDFSAIDAKLEPLRARGGGVAGPTDGITTSGNLNAAPNPSVADEPVTNEA